MSKSEIYWYIAGGFVGMGIFIYLLVPLDYAHPDTGIFIFAAIFSAMLSIWCFTLPYCFTYRVIEDIACTDGKFRFNCGGKNFENTGRVFFKITIYTSEPPRIPTHMFIWLRSGPWLCPFALWEDCAKAVNNETAK